MPAVSREEGDKIYFRILEIRDEVAIKVKEKARQVEQVTDPFWDSAPLVKEAYKEFGEKVHNEYDDTPHKVLAELFLSSSKLYFYSRNKLQGEVCQILQEKSPEATL